MFLLRLKADYLFLEKNNHKQQQSSVNCFSGPVAAVCGLVAADDGRLGPSLAVRNGPVPRLAVQAGKERRPHQAVGGHAVEGQQSVVVLYRERAVRGRTRHLQVRLDYKPT
jgi:hypothetical protein